MMAVVDEKDGQISFGYGFPKLSQKDNTDLEEARVNIAPVTGKTMESCVQTYDSRLEKLADCNHMKVLVFGENLMEDTGRYADVLSYLKQTGLFPRNIYVCVAEDPLALFETEEDLPQDLGSYLEQYLQNQESAGSGKLFSSGFGANAGILRALLGQNDIALVDPYIHTSAMAGLKGTNILSKRLAKDLSFYQ